MSLVTQDSEIVAAKRQQRQVPVLEYTSDGEVVVVAANGSKYRRSVCVVIMNEQGYFLGCRRYDDRQVWQFVQGGAKVHESVQQTAERELFEEIGLPATHLRFVGEILSFTSGEEAWAAFRYKSKSWRKSGIVGQELYPLLYLADTGIIDVLHFKAVPGVRQEFCGAMWMRLEEFVRYCSPSKATVVSNICMAVSWFTRCAFANGAGFSPCDGDASQPLGAIRGTNVRSDEATSAGGGTGGAGSHRHHRRRGPRNRRPRLTEPGDPPRCESRRNGCDEKQKDSRGEGIIKTNKQGKLK
ncbi:NUDIX hydrolase [Trypanosoma conorhini]|uniref:NUDIX hydrolase n=1 Tax=Trypanosoma conorhini TaxID=83891 RepID=A0A3R7NEF9_9TRYP|nr:NUDIX hydrolase [Trypanosoma conorhini]RNF17422.1 NUDIX hydrolase [Trypanosoma conorhini]